MMLSPIRLLLGLSLSCLLIPQAQVLCQNFPHSKARLILSHTQIKAEGDFLAGLYLQLEPGWHTYWQNPGDSGASPILNFSASQAGVNFSEVLWPRPSRYETGHLTTFVYFDEVVLMVRGHLPAPLTDPSLDIKLNAEWLVCKEECVPAFGEFSQKLRLGKELIPNDVHSLLFTQYERQLPPLEAIAASILSSHENLLLGLPGHLSPIDFFPGKNTRLSHARPNFFSTTDGWQIEIPVVQEPNQAIHQMEGLLLEEDRVFWIRAQGSPSSLQQDSGPSRSLAWHLLFAFLGGLLLNLMPCVFPIISLKIFGFMAQREQAQQEIRRQSLGFCVGVIVSFLAIAILVQILRHFGAAVGWGFQLQSPPFLAFLVLVFTGLGLSFLGLFDLAIHLPSSWTQSKPSSRWTGHMLTGVLAVLVASPCTGPFMGAAMGYALAQNLWISLLTFFLLGLGFAAPYLWIALFPSWVRALPKSGPWLLLLKEFMFFPMMLTALWLLWIFGRIQGVDAMALLAGSAVLLCAALWFFTHEALLVKRRRYFFALLMLASAGFLAHQALKPQPTAELAQDKPGIIWEAFSSQRLEQLRRDGAKVFVNFTADWCLTCKANEAVTFHHPDVIDFITRHQINMLKADWTHYDPNITAFLKTFKRASVPFYVYYQGTQSTKVLPELLLPKVFINMVESQP